MTSGIDWGLIEDQIAVKEGKELPPVARVERWRRVLSLMDSVVELAGNLGITKTNLAKELGISRPHFYRWQQGKDLPTMKNYRRLLQLSSHLETLAREQGFQPLPPLINP